MLKNINQKMFENSWFFPLALIDIFMASITIYMKKEIMDLYRKINKS